MNGPDHYRKADQLVDYVTDQDGYPDEEDNTPTILALAQVHATLAQTAVLQRLVEVQGVAQNITAAFVGTREWDAVLEGVKA